MASSASHDGEDVTQRLPSLKPGKRLVYGLRSAPRPRIRSASAFGRGTATPHAPATSSPDHSHRRHLDGGGVSVTIEEHFRAAIGERRGTDAADRICQVCVDLIDVHAASISLIYDGANVGTLGVSSEPARTYDEVQFTVGEGPCLDAVAHGVPLVVDDFDDHREVRWPVYGSVMLSHHIRGVLAMPVTAAGRYVGALELFLTHPTPVHGEKWAAAKLAADLASGPLLYLLDLLELQVGYATNDPDDEAWRTPDDLVRAEIAQATGMLMAQLHLQPDKALLRLRAHAYAIDAPATDVAKAIIDRRLHLDTD